MQPCSTDRQFHNLPFNMTSSAELEERMDERNGSYRYKDVRCFKDNNVAIHFNDNTETKSNVSDMGELHGRHFYATHAPKQEYIGVFYAFLEQKSIDVIVVLTATSESGTPKAYDYWSTSPAEEHTSYKKFTLALPGKNKIVTVLQYTDFPDFGPPDETKFVHFLEKFRDISLTGSKNVLVHCSAGVGRTGTFLVAWQLLNRPSTALFTAVTQLRQKRPFMVNSPTQRDFLCTLKNNLLKKKQAWYTSNPPQSNTTTSKTQTSSPTSTNQTGPLTVKQPTAKTSRDKESAQGTRRVATSAPQQVHVTPHTTQEASTKHRSLFTETPSSTPTALEFNTNLPTPTFSPPTSLFSSAVLMLSSSTVTIRKFLRKTRTGNARYLVLFSGLLLLLGTLYYYYYC